MKTIQRNTLMFAMTALLAMPATLMAADVAKNAAKDEHSGHHHGQKAAAAPAPVQAAPVQAAPATPTATQDPMQAMRARMMEIHSSKDPNKRKQLMEAQMKDMEAMMKDDSCPMMTGDKGGMGMMGGGMMGHGGMAGPKK